MPQNQKGTGPRPGWRGPGMAKRSKASLTPKSTSSKDHSPLQESSISTELQQQLLGVFRNSFHSLSEAGSEAVRPILQEVKQALFERDFDRAFGRQDYLEAYAFRWSPSRTLCYVSILVDIQDYLSEILLTDLICQSQLMPGDGNAVEHTTSIDTNPTVQVVCLGGGAAEVVAFGGILKYRLQTATPSPEEENLSTTESVGSMSTSKSKLPSGMDLHLVDTAAWGSVIHNVSQNLVVPPPLSKYASTSAKAANASLLPEGILATTFHQENLLDMDKSALEALLGQQQALITMLFTLNELYSTSITATTTFLLKLTAAVRRGTMLLVVDSPGSYSEAAMGKDSRKYPMQWLMDHTLLEKRQERGEESCPDWEKIVSDDSRWFRLPEGLKYPISLENMRYQIHLFRRI